MTLNLEKDQRVNIQKESGGASKFVIGLGWQTDADLDASAVLCKQQPGGDPVCIGSPGFIFFNQKKSACGGVEHLGDALSGVGSSAGNTGEGANAGEDDERIVIDTAKLDPNVDQVDIWATIFEAAARNQKFGSVKDAHIRIYAGKDQGGEIVPDGAPIINFDLSEDYSTDTAVQFGSLYRKDGEWRFQAIGQGAKVEIAGVVSSYGL